MLKILLSKREIAGTALLITGAVTGLIASRYFGTRKVSAAERLAEALLETDRLREGAHHQAESSEKALADCAAYLVNMAYRAADSVGAASGSDDPLGYSRTHTHPYTHASATVLTEAVVPECLLTYAVNLPDVGEVRGIRRIGAARLAGVNWARPVPDTVQITLPEGYTAQVETEFEVPDYLLSGRVRLYGAATMRDNRGNVGRLNIANDGTVSGTVTRDARVIGRFEGNTVHGVHFKQNQIESGS